MGLSSGRPQNQSDRPEFSGAAGSRQSHTPDCALDCASRPYVTRSLIKGEVKTRPQVFEASVCNKHLKHHFASPWASLDKTDPGTCPELVRKV